MAFDLDEIRKEVRRLTGRKSTANPTDAELNRRIRLWAGHFLPAEVKTAVFEDFFESTVSSGVDTINQPAAYYVLNSPAYIYQVDESDTLELNWFVNPDEFYTKWPIGNTFTDQKPIDVLYFENILTFRPSPDDTYTVRIKGIKRSDAFDLSDGDEPGDGSEIKYVSDVSADALNVLVAYGVSLQLLASFRDFSSIAQLKPLYEEVRDQVMDRDLQILFNQRAIPRF